MGSVQVVAISVNLLFRGVVGSELKKLPSLFQVRLLHIKQGGDLLLEFTRVFRLGNSVEIL